MTRAELYELEREVMNYLSPKVDDYIEKAQESNPNTHEFFVRHGRCSGALQIYNSLTDFFVKKFDDLEKEGADNV